MPKFKDMLVYLRKREGMSQAALADRLGVSASTIGMYEQGRREPDFETEEHIADIFNVDINTLRGVAASESFKVPVLGRVAAGIPIDAIEEIIDYEEVDEKMASLGDLFGLKIKGDSMTPRICDGDVVIVRKQNSADSGDIVIATINGDDAVCKRLQIYTNAILLYSMNPAYEPIDVTGREDFHIMGKVVELRGKF